MLGFELGGEQQQARDQFKKTFEELGGGYNDTEDFTKLSELLKKAIRQGLRYKLYDRPGRPVPRIKS